MGHPAWAWRRIGRCRDDRPGAGGDRIAGGRGVAGDAAGGGSRTGTAAAPEDAGRGPVCDLVWRVSDGGGVAGDFSLARGAGERQERMDCGGWEMVPGG